MSEINILLDTSILVEFFDSTAKGVILKEYFNSDYRIFTPSIVIAELSSKLKRKGFEPTRFINEIKNSTNVVSLNEIVAEESGKLHAELRKTNKNVSLADCIIITHAKTLNSKVITCDRHFENYKNSIII